MRSASHALAGLLAFLAIVILCTCAKSTAAMVTPLTETEAANMVTPFRKTGAAKIKEKNDDAIDMTGRLLDDVSLTPSPPFRSENIKHKNFDTKKRQQT
jgi:type III secretory pathway lipoprotein EscJ